MRDAVTFTIELAVGLGCLGAATGLRRHPSLRVLALFFTIGGIAAVGHALWALATGR